MQDSSRLKSCRREPPLHRRRHWCCAFVTPPLSPEKPGLSRSHSSSSSGKKTELPSNSPLTQQQKVPLSRWILSPGRVSPISDNTVNDCTSLKPVSRSNSLEVPLQPADLDAASADEVDPGRFDVRLKLKGNNGESLILELSSEVLIANSAVFAELITDYRKYRNGLCRIEVPDVENLNVFHETIELMFEDDIPKKLLNIGAFRAIRILEVSASIKFTRGVSSCLQYMAAVPWAEEEEERLRELYAKLNLDDGMIKEISERTDGSSSVTIQQALTKKLILSITTCTEANSNAHRELKSLMKGLLSRSSVYESECPSLSKNDIFAVCETCLSSLRSLLEEASGADLCNASVRNEKEKPLLERISYQVDNINWLFDILLNHQIAEKFVDLWAIQQELLKMRDIVSPLVRYELSRVSAKLFIAMGSGKLHCQLETRSALVQMWFKPMLLDFGWLQRCKRGLDMKAVEEALGQMLLTLPLKEQYALFMNWLQCFSKHGAECPNLSKAFQIWWRRSFSKSSVASAVECR